MSVPDFQTLMLPTLKVVATKSIVTTKDVIATLIEQFQLSYEDQAQMLPSGKQRVVDNRVYWCLSYLGKAGLIKRPGRGTYEVTPSGKNVLAENPERIDINFLRRFESFQKFRETSRTDLQGAQAGAAAPEIGVDPVEQLESSYQKLKNEVCAELLAYVHQVSPTDFELLVIELLKRMGYGVPGIESVTHRGGAGDGGIDGEISEDKLGLDMIYIQAKKYAESTVGRPAIQQFVGSLNERKAKKGIFITTSTFTKDAVEYVQRIDVRIALIDGKKLSDLMYQHDLGVAPEQRFEVKTIDPDYFAA